MKILFAAAVLLGLATAAKNKLMAFGSTGVLTGNNGIFDVSYGYSFDSNYNTEFEFAIDATNAYQIDQSYELNLDTFATASLTFNILGFYTLNVEVEADLLDVTPIRQYINMVHPYATLMNGTPFTVSFAAEYDLNFGDVSVYYTPDVKVTSMSIYDYITGLIAGTSTLTSILPTASADWTMQGDDDVMITDPYLTFSLSKTIGVNSASWYGTQTWYDISL